MTIQKVHNEKDEVIVEEKGYSLVNIYLIIDGQLHYGEQLFPKGSVFGIEFVYPEYSDQTKLEFDLHSKNCTFGHIEVERWFQILGSQDQNLENLFKKNQFEIIQKRKFKLRKKSTICRNLTLHNLVVQKVLNENSNQALFVVRDLVSQRNFLLKVFSRKMFKDLKAKESIVNEIEITKTFSFPFLVKLYNVFQDSNSLYLLISPVFQMDMFDMIQ